MKYSEACNMNTTIERALAVLENNDRGRKADRHW